MNKFLSFLLPVVYPKYMDTEILRHWLKVSLGMIKTNQKGSVRKCRTAENQIKFFIMMKTNFNFLNYNFKILKIGRYKITN